jgi:hypothetical protein
METKTYKGTVTEYQGKRLETPVGYTVNWESFETIAEAKDSENWLSDAEVLREINKKQFTAAKAKEYQSVTKGLKEDYENSAEFKRKNFIAAALAMGKTLEQAEALADSMA